MTKRNGERKSLAPSMATMWEHRRLVFSLILCLAMALAVAVALRTYGPWSAPGSTLYATPTASPIPAPHQIYAFSFDILPPDPSYPMLLHAGKPVTFRWTPSSFFSVHGDAPPANRPFPVHCTLALYGPYLSLDDLTKATNANAPGDGIAPPGPPAFTTSPPNMTDWDSTPHQIEFVLPTTLQAGYYQADSECQYERDQGASGTGFPIQIDA